MMSKNKDILFILYSMPIIMSLVYFDRAIFNNVIFSLNIIDRNTGHNYEALFENLIDIHVTFFTLSDFVTGLIQLYLTYKLGIKIQA
jgi:hypothetical protein